MDAGNQPLIVTSIEELFDALRPELESPHIFPDDEPAVEVVITVEKKMTQKEVDDLPEWEG